MPPLLLGLGLLWLAFCAACAPVKPPALAPDARDVVKLRWIKAYDGETRAEVQTGLCWGLSFLGARLEKSANGAFAWEGDTVTLNIEQAGVEPQTLAAWRDLLIVLKASDEYRAAGAIDIGRFFMLTLGSSKHYFALTGARESYEEARRAYRFGEKTGAIIESGIAHGHRLIELADATSAAEIAFVAHEGTGSIPAGTFEPLEHELMDVMPNGQLRIALYGASGALKDAATPALTAAGKPGRCLWCHEIRFLPAMNNHTDTAGHLTTSQFDAEIARRMALLDAQRRTLDSQIDFTALNDHRFAELLYLSFNEPTLERVAREWNVPVPEAARRLGNSAVTSDAGEFAELGVHRYQRDDVDALAPYSALRVPASARLPSAYEPDLLSAPHRNTAPVSP